MCCVQFPTHRGFSGEEEDGEGWREINVMVFQCNQHTPSCVPHLLLNWVQDRVVALHILENSRHIPNDKMACIELLPHVGIKRCYEARIEESEKAGSHWESNPGHLHKPGVLGLIPGDCQPIFTLLHLNFSLIRWTCFQMDIS